MQPLLSHVFIYRVDLLLYTVVNTFSFLYPYLARKGHGETIAVHGPFAFDVPFAVVVRTQDLPYLRESGFGVYFNIPISCLFVKVQMPCRHIVLARFTEQSRHSHDICFIVIGRIEQVVVFQKPEEECVQVYARKRIV